MFPTYQEAVTYARVQATKLGMDHGLERLGASYRVFILPRPENRYGHELRCEVVRPNDPV